MHHLSVSFAGSPERSLLTTDLATPERTGPMQINVQIGAPRSGPAAGPGWEMVPLAYFKGAMTDDAFLARARFGEPDAQLVQVAEVHFYLAQKARLASDPVSELAHLEACVATPVPSLIEYQVARVRLASLRDAAAAGNPTTE